MNPSENFRKAEFAKINPCEKFGKTKFAKIDLLEKQFFWPCENKSTRKFVPLRYILIAVDLSKQKELDADPKAI